MTSSVNTAKVNIPDNTTAYLYKDGIFVCEVPVTKPGIYTIDDVVLGGGQFRYIKRYNTIRTHNGIRYNSWSVSHTP